jgi:putative transposase
VHGNAPTTSSHFHRSIYLYRGNILEAFFAIQLSYILSDDFLLNIMDKPIRRSIRLKHYNYAQSGWYFVTICTANRLCLFGDIIDHKMILNEFGDITIAEWEYSRRLRQEIEFDAWVLMPNHLHGIVIISQDVNSWAIHEKYGGVARRKPRSLSTFISGFKAATTRKINQLRKSPGETVWQRNYYEHIIRNETALEKIREYIADNPRRWMADQLHPNNPSKW